jgi:hypothetical protein
MDVLQPFRKLSPCARNVCTMHMEVKGKVYPKTCHESIERKKRYCCTLSSASALDGDGWLTPRPSRFTPGEDPVPIVHEAGWAPGPIRTGAGNLSYIGNRSVHRTARGESLYRLRRHMGEWKYFSINY